MTGHVNTIYVGLNYGTDALPSFVRHHINCKCQTNQSAFLIILYTATCMIIFQTYICGIQFMSFNVSVAFLYLSSGTNVVCGGWLDPADWSWLNGRPER